MNIFLIIIYNSINMFESQLKSEVDLSKILSYNPKDQKQIEEYRKRLPIEEFKQISHDRMKHEYKILDDAQVTDQKSMYCWEYSGMNRYSDIFPYKHNRVLCKDIQDFYVNASHMRSVVDGKNFAIFAQAPVKKAIQNFWVAVYKQNVKKIIMLCSFNDPTRGRQAEQYWPDIGKVEEFGKAKISVIQVKEEIIEDEFRRKIFRIEGQQGVRQVEHIHWTGWSDLKKPLGENSQKLFRGLVDECLQMIEKDELFIIHCSAGIGRTGTLGGMIEAHRCAKQFGKLSVFEIVENMRRHRMYCVQTSEQYYFMYKQLLRQL